MTTYEYYEPDVEAVFFDGTTDTRKEVMEFLEKHTWETLTMTSPPIMEGGLVTITLGDKTLEPGKFLVKGERGKMTQVTPRDFLEHYRVKKVTDATVQS